MFVLTVVADGCQRVLRAPALVLGLWAFFTVVTVPVTLRPTDAHLALIEASAMDPSVALLAVVRNGPALVHVALSMFVLGGLMDRLARDRATASFGFFGACGVFVFRFARLALLALPPYLALLLWVYPRWLRTEPIGTVMLVALVGLVHLLFDYAKVRMVVEDRRSAVGAVAAGWRFIRRHALIAVALAAVNGSLAYVTWWLAARYEIGVTTAIYPYWLARALLRLVFIASHVAHFQRRLAHAGYTARPLPTWPESPAAEAVRPS